MTYKLMQANPSSRQTNVHVLQDVFLTKEIEIPQTTDQLGTKVKLKS